MEHGQVRYTTSGPGHKIFHAVPHDATLLLVGWHPVEDSSGRLQGGLALLMITQSRSPCPCIAPCDIFLSHRDAGIICYSSLHWMPWPRHPASCNISILTTITLHYNWLLICLTEWAGSSLRADTRFTSPSPVPSTRRWSIFVCPTNAWKHCEVQHHSLVRRI